LSPAAEAEIAVGIECYWTKGPPCPARARESPEDFVVEEHIAPGGMTAEEDPKYFPVYRVEKRSIDTLHMAAELSEALHSRVSYGGMKDKRARAVQYATPTSLRSERPREVVRERFTASLVGYAPRPLSRASVTGNRFQITLRDCCEQIGLRVGEAMGEAEARRLPNFYGLQRFGASGAGSHRIGKALVRREFEEAARVMLFAERRSDGEASAAAREAMAKGDYEEGARLLPPGMDVERLVARELGRHPGEWVRALRAVPVRLRRLYVQAYQSMLFNRTLSRALARGEDIALAAPGDNWAEVSADGLVASRVMGVRDPQAPGAIPMVQMVGYAFRDYGSRFDACVAEALEGEGVAPRDFYVEEMQEVSGEGGFRRAHLAIREASWKVDDRAVRLSFTLARGQYATVLLREITKPGDPEAAGIS